MVNYGLGDGKGSRSTPSLQGYPMGRQMNRELQMRDRFREENSKPISDVCNSCKMLGEANRCLRSEAQGEV